MTELRAGIIGLGVGAKHIPGYNQYDGCKVTKICDFDEAKCEEIKSRYPEIATTIEANDILTDPDIDVVSIASYDDAHAQQVLTALANNKHVFVEKPLCMTEEELKKIQQAFAEKPQLHLSSNLILRTSPRFIDLKRRIQNGSMGDIYYMEGDYEYGRIHKILEGWRGQLEFYSVVHGGMIHLIDLALWLRGRKIVRVSAVGNQLATKDTDFKFNDFVLATAEFDDGSIAKFSVNYACVKPHFHGVKVFGTKATFENGPESAKLIESREPEEYPRALHTPYPGVQKGDLIPSFLDQILGRGEALATAEEVFETMAVALAVEKSVALGAPVEVNSITS